MRTSNCFRQLVICCTIFHNFIVSQNSIKVYDSSVILPRKLRAKSASERKEKQAPTSFQRKVARQGEIQRKSAADTKKFPLLTTYPCSALQARFQQQWPNYDDVGDRCVHFLDMISTLVGLFPSSFQWSNVFIVEGAVEESSVVSGLVVEPLVDSSMYLKLPYAYSVNFFEWFLSKHEQVI